MAYHNKNDIRISHCTNCLMLAKQDQGYSNFDLTGVTYFCILNNNPHMPHYTPIIHDPLHDPLHDEALKYYCEHFKHFLTEQKGMLKQHDRRIKIDAEKLQKHIITYTNSDILRALINLNPDIEERIDSWKKIL